jgi:hypothetical protein
MSTIAPVVVDPLADPVVAYVSLEPSSTAERALNREEYRMSILDRCQALFQTARKGETRLPSRVSIPSSHVDEPERLGPPLEPDRHYFQVRVNEMFLSHARQWYAQYDPLVFVGSEFIYDKAETAVPVMVGPSLLERFGKKRDLPGGTVFEDTRVAGLHPYRGGRLAVTVMLYRVQRVNYARELLKVVDSTVGALDFSTAVGAYTKVAGAVLDGVDALLGLGSAQAVVGYRREMDPDAGDAMAGGYFALIDAPEADVDIDRLFVRKGRLVEGDALDTAQPFRSADYILYSLSSTATRSDERMLSFYPQWQRTLQEAALPSDQGWTSAKSNMLALYQSMVLSPDLTSTHAEALTTQYQGDLKEKHNRAVGLSNLGERAAAAERPLVNDRARARSLEVLTM